MGGSVRNQAESNYIDRVASGETGQDEYPDPDDAGPEAPSACVWPDVWVDFGGCYNCHDCHDRRGL